MTSVRAFALTALLAAASSALLPANAAAQLGTGTVSASFNSPTPACITTTEYNLLPPGTRVPVCDGMGTDAISWGDPGTIGIGQSAFSFARREFIDVPLGQKFVLGTLTYFNGTIFVGTEISEVFLNIQTFSSQSAFNQMLSLPLSIVQTVNQGISPLADADFLFFSNALQFGSFRVLEGNFATVEILGSFNSLNNEGFGQIIAGEGFLSPSVGIIPEPGTLGLCAFGVVTLLGVSRRRTARLNA